MPLASRPVDEADQDVARHALCDNRDAFSVSLVVWAEWGADVDLAVGAEDPV